MYNDSKIMRHLEFDKIIFLDGFENEYEESRMFFYDIMIRKCNALSNKNCLRIFEQIKKLELEIKQERHERILQITEKDSPEGLIRQKFFDEVAEYKSIQLEGYKNTILEYLPRSQITKHENCLWIEIDKTRFTLFYREDVERIVLFNTKIKEHYHYNNIDGLINYLILIT
jgi:calcineurin-like phosphoesterase family protein